MVIGVRPKNRPTDGGAIFFASEVEFRTSDLDRLNPKSLHKNLLLTHLCSESDALDQSLAPMGT